MKHNDAVATLFVNTRERICFWQIVTTSGLGFRQVHMRGLRGM